MDSSMVYSLWKLVDEMHVSQLVGLGDGELIELLTAKLIAGRRCSEWDEEIIQSYIGDRLPLIRELSRGGF